MVKYFGALLIVMALAAPAFAQDVPQFEIAMGYGNLDLAGQRHGGFVSTQTINLNSWLGFENYIGYYPMGTDATYGKSHLVTVVPGAKISYRNDRVMPYALVGLGGTSIQFPQSGVGTGNSFTFRYGGGVDIPFKQNFAIKFDVSRLSFHSGGSWVSGTNFATGLVIRITQ